MAKSRSIGGIYASLSLRDGGFKKGIKSAAASMKDFAAKSAKYAAGATVAGVTALGTALAVGTVHTLDHVDALGDLSAQTGIAIADMMLLQRAYADGGRAAEDVGKDVGKMQKAIVAATQGGKDPFASIGLSAKSLLSMNPADQFKTIGAAIMRIQNPAERTAKAMEIFGKGGMGLTTVFSGIDGAVTSLGKMPATAQQFGAAMGEANDLLGHLPIKSQQFFTGFTAGIVGELLPQLKRIDEYDFTEVGMSVGASLATGFQGLLDGTIFTVISEKFYASMAMVMGDIQNLFIESLKAAYDLTFGIGNTIAEGLMTGDFSKVDPMKIAERAGAKANPYEDFSKDLTKDADELWNGLKAKMEENSKAAADLAIKPAIIDPIITTEAQEILPEAKSVDTKQASNTANEYQKRGLSLDAATIEDPENPYESMTNSLVADAGSLWSDMRKQMEVVSQKMMTDAGSIWNSVKSVFDAKAESPIQRLPIAISDQQETANTGSIWDEVKGIFDSKSEQVIQRVSTEKNDEDKSENIGVLWGKFASAFDSKTSQEPLKIPDIVMPKDDDQYNPARAIMPEAMAADTRAASESVNKYQAPIIADKSPATDGKADAQYDILKESRDFLKLIAEEKFGPLVFA
jgi:hypothetical protein